MKTFLRHLNPEDRAPAGPRLGRSPAIRFAVCLLFSALCPPISATEPIDLGQGLGYVRVESIDAAIKPLSSATTLVLDLRHTTATPEALPAFSTALAARAAGSRLYVLVSPATAPALAAVLKGPLITLGIKDSLPAPQVVVAQSAEHDQRAYEAHANGTGLAPLLSGKVEKERFDEASLVHEFNQGHPDPQPAPTGRTEGNAANAPERLTDRVLQRAMHLHRALLALKR